MPPLPATVSDLWQQVVSQPGLQKVLLGLTSTLGLSTVIHDNIDKPAATSSHELSDDFTTKDQCPLDIPYSCSNSTDMDLNLCCFEYPGGVVLQTQFWDYSPPIGPNDSFTLHGLWPDNCDGSFEQFCDSSMEISDPAGIIEQHDEELLEYMHMYWKDFKGNDAYLWKHEWNKHGTCYSTLKSSCYGKSMNAYQNVVDYFNQSVELYKTLPTFDWLVEAGIEPSTTETYTKDEILKALTAKFGAEPYIRCDTTSALQEVWYFHHLKGPLIGGEFIPIDTLTNSRCRATGIRFPPKIPHLKPTGTHSADLPVPTSPLTKGFLRLSGQQGCLIRNGHWYISGSCAGYSMEQLETGSVHLKSSGGWCTISEGAFICARDVSPFEFEYDEETQLISANGKTTFHADSVPHGKIQQKIMLGSGKIEFNLKFTKQH